VDLGGFYLDVVKDRLYTTPRGGCRRSAQTAMHHIAEAMVRWLAPIFPSRGGDLAHMPGERAESVFLATWWELPAGEAAAAAIDWSSVARDARRRAARTRTAAGRRRIGAPLDAEVDLYAAPEVRAALEPLGEELRFVLITSGVHVHPAEVRTADAVPADPAAAADLWSMPGCPRP